MEGVIIPLLNSVSDLRLLLKFRLVCKRWKSMMSNKTMIDTDAPDDDLFLGSQIIAIFPKLIGFRGAWLMFDNINSLPLNIQYCRYLTTPDSIFEDPGDILIKQLKKHGSELDLMIDACVGHPVHVCQDFLDLADYVQRVDVIEAYAVTKGSKIYLKLRGAAIINLPFDLIDTLELYDILPLTDLKPYHKLVEDGKIRQLVTKYTASNVARTLNWE